MVSSTSLELKLSLKPAYVPKTITNLMKDLSNIDDASDKLVVLDDYINHFEEELNSIAAFKRQLPQCMLLLIEALGTLKDEFMNIKNGMGESENEGALMEFLASKRKVYEEISGEDNQMYDFKGKGLMRPMQHKPFRDFIQASNQNPITFNNNNRFASVNGEDGLNLRANPTLNCKPKPLTQPTTWKNSRRSWSPQLHARFVQTLHRLGGIEVATPKQIREMMQIEGLTNDQVKSHLQKYRLHCRKLSGSNARCSGSFEDPWHPRIYYGDPLFRKNLSRSNSNPGGHFERKSYSAFN